MGQPQAPRVSSACSRRKPRLTPEQVIGALHLTSRVAWLWCRNQLAAERRRPFRKVMLQNRLIKDGEACSAEWPHTIGICRGYVGWNRQLARYTQSVSSCRQWADPELPVLSPLSARGGSTGMGEGRMREAIKASFIASLGPAFGSFVGMTVMVLALGGAYAFGREAAGVGSIMYELIAARAGAERRRAADPRGHTVPALRSSSGSAPWALSAGC